MTCQIDQEAGQRLDNLTQRSSKPRLIKIYKFWLCEGSNGWCAHGLTPAKAYELWLETTLPTWTRTE